MMHLAAVDFPDPDSPTSPKISPLRSWKDTPSRARRVRLVEDIFYDPRHPYTWGLLRSLPAWAEEGQPLYTIPGMPPSLRPPPIGEAIFGARSSSSQVAA